jgi:hypothetical protein
MEWCGESMNWGAACRLKHLATNLYLAVAAPIASRPASLGSMLSGFVVASSSPSQVYMTDDFLNTDTCFSLMPFLAEDLDKDVRYVISTSHFRLSDKFLPPPQYLRLTVISQHGQAVPPQARIQQVVVLRLWTPAAARESPPWQPCNIVDQQQSRFTDEAKV